MGDPNHEGSGVRATHRTVWILTLLATSMAAIYAALALTGDLKENSTAYLVCHSVLTLLMLVAFQAVRRGSTPLRLILGAALVFRLITVAAPPTLSDDVYRYVWDGRVQAHGVQPYRYAPDDSELVHLRDEAWTRINHPELRTIYPPLAQAGFALLGFAGAGVHGFKLALALLDFGAILALLGWLRQTGRPAACLVLYAWNPLAVVESAGSGHIEPLGVLLVILAATWSLRGKLGAAMLALAASVHVKLLSLVLAPRFVRRGGRVGFGILILGLLLPLVPYAVTGPAVGAGLFDYAKSWEYNATLYAAIHGFVEWLAPTASLRHAITSIRASFPELPLPWDAMYAGIWPRELARVSVGMIALLWIAVVTLRSGMETGRGILFLLGGVLLLSPTLHPWYLLWILPWAASELSWGWLVLAATIPVTYAASPGDVPWVLRGIEYIPAALAAVWQAVRVRAVGLC